MSALEERVRSRGLAFAAAAGIAALALLAPARAEAQAPAGPVVRFDPGNGSAIYDNAIPQRHPNSAFPELAYFPESAFQGLVFKERLNLIEPERPWCDFLPLVPNQVICPGLPQLRGYRLVLGLPHRNWATVAPAVPKLPGPNVIKGGKKRDVINGGQSNERIDTGKGKDDVDPGSDRDDVKTGKGNDSIDSRDGEVDRINGGKGKDVAVPDPKDKLRNVEVVKRK
jgi:hypothetical protein